MQEKQNAAIFIDYEHWYISLDKNFHAKPDIEAFTEEVKKNYNVVSYTFFGDFSNPSLQNEMHKIRGFTNDIVETKNGGGYFKKDFTDFILLDYIYRQAITEKNIDTFIIFTGDGHFTSVVRFLRNECRKNVGIYGITGATNAQLKQSASFFKEIPSDTEVYRSYYKMLVDNFSYLTVHREFGEKSTMAKVVERVSQKNSVGKKEITKALELMIKDGYVYRASAVGENNKKIEVLKPNWELLARDGLWVQP